MLDREGFRPNVGIILLNARNQVFWGKRLRTHSWQFPQGGIKYGESPEQAMFRELHEEVGLRPDHVRILARTRDWLRYEVPEHFIRKDARGHYKGQKQIWFLLMLTLIAVLFRILWMIIGDHILTVATVTMVLLVPSMLIAEMLERYLGVYPG